MRYILILLGLMFANVASAIDCEKVPGCDRLGYSKTEDPNCADGGYVLCPFDETYKKCIDYDCAKLGFTESDKTLWCADLIKCAGNPKMTLCQKPCLATDYNSLKELAGSGKCKVVTMRKDIEIPLNQNVTLAANTVIDGNGHTLTSSGNIKSLIIFSMDNKTGMKNIKLRHTHTGSHSGVELLKALTYTTAVTLKDVDIFISSDDNSSWTAVIDNGAFNISGNFMLEMELRKSGAQLAGFWRGTYNFTDAQVSIKGSGYTVNIFDSSQVTFTNSSLHAETTGFLFVLQGSVTLKNTQSYWKGGYIFRVSQTDSKLDLILQEKAVLELRLNTETGKDKTTIKTSDNTAALILNGTTYRPKQAGTTLLSEIPNSGNWEVVQ